MKDINSFGGQVNTEVTPITWPIKFLLWISKGKAGHVQAELRAIRDFLAGRYGDFDRKKANYYG